MVNAKKSSALNIEQPEIVKVPTTKAAARAKLDIAVDDE